MTAASWPTLGIPPVAVPAWRRLSAALTDASPPCAVEPALWFSTDGDDIETAAHRCRGCHAIGPCDEYAAIAREPVGVWAGVDRTRRQRDRRAAETSANRCGCVVQVESVEVDLLVAKKYSTLRISDHLRTGPETNENKEQA